MPSCISAPTVQASDDSGFLPPGTCVDASPAHGSPDCNNGLGGDHAFVVKSYTSDPFQAITGSSIDITGSREHPELGDMANGIGGDYRYVITSEDLDSPTEIDDVQLWRSQDDFVSLSEFAKFGWDGISTNINHRRTGAYLYLVWKNVRA